jgi:dual specificity tyrosine-phosphorylation-regulated kinase 2/3/4
VHKNDNQHFLFAVFMYIQSRFYRAPEVVMGYRYDCKIDMWSLACIMAELYTGDPIFPGRDEEDQMACIMSVIGAPPLIMAQRSPKKDKYFGM